MTQQSESSLPLPGLPAQPVDRIVAPLARFLHVEAASGIVLLGCTVVALVLANSPLAERFAHFWETPIGFLLGPVEIRHSLAEWINDALMAIFFFVVGLEVKRELVLGELRELRAALLPMAAALGGMVVPALVYLAIQLGRPGQRGWGIPMATDIAFVVGCLAVLGPRVPRGLRVLLLSLAIVDDIGAILVIAIGYSQHLNVPALIWAIVGIGVILLLSRIGVRSIGIYVLFGVGVWFAVMESGIHATIAGVILGLLTPARTPVSKGLVSDVVGQAGQLFRGEGLNSGLGRRQVLRQLRITSREAISPLERLETALHPWVSFVIMPIFALANAGVPMQLASLKSPVASAVMLGLVFGKPIGIVLASWMALKSGLAKLPDRVTWGMIAAGGMLAGIGFTMALFIADLALSDNLLADAKIGVLAGSLLSAAIGMALLVGLLPKIADSAVPTE